ncbi:unnamed protein product [Mytilus edulis]|uniref:Apple domain-containing protein n=1 Tax=Mytilus edulis TaxID=6550 RepID=A0A8S3RQU4_MYTED|nr:unnamed protein product [Mytilus edulis]
MGFNSLKDISGLFENLKELKHLDLRHNLVTSVDMEMFKGLTKLEYLNLSENQLICNCAIVSLKGLYFVINHGKGIMCPDMKGADLENVPDYELCTNKGDYCRQENVTIINGHSLATVYGISVIRCAFMCDVNQECNAFQHLDDMERICSLWNIRDKSSWLMNVTRYVDLYDRC